MEIADSVHFQAHRGGLREVPENTLVAYRHAWSLGGIPEIDIQTTRDGVIVCLHDDTLARTTNAEGALRDTRVPDLTLEEVQRWDAGKWFSAEFEGEHVPTLEEVLKDIAGHPERQIYLDLKAVDLAQLSALIGRYGVVRQILFSHNRVESCRRMKAALPGIRTMLWIGGEAADIQKSFRKAAASGFRGLDQVQLHLKPVEGSGAGIQYALDRSFLEEALRMTREAHVDLEVLPFSFDASSLNALLDMGIRWYATDEPKRFKGCVEAYFQARSGVDAAAER